MAAVTLSSASDPAPPLINWSFEEQSARWGEAGSARIYSLSRSGGALIIHVPRPVPYDSLRYLAIVGPLSTERLTLEYDTYKRFYPSVLWKLVRGFPRMLVARGGWRYLFGSATFTRESGDVRVSVPSPYITPFHTPGKPDPFGDFIIDRLAVLEGRLFSADEVHSIIAQLRIETLGPERFRRYLEGTR